MKFPYVKQANTKMKIHKYINTEHTTKCQKEEKNMWHIFETIVQQFKYDKCRIRTVYSVQLFAQNAICVLKMPIVCSSGNVPVVTTASLQD